MTEANDDRRRYFRIRDEVPLTLEALDAAGVERLMAEMENRTETRFGLAAKFAATTSQMDHVLNRIRERDADVALYLQSLNQKLDAVARVLLLEEQAIAGMKVVDVDLSASGICVVWPTAMTPGQPVRVELITAAANARVLALGRVIRCRPAHEAGLDHPGYQLAIDFDLIGNHEEDLIMQEVMRRQAALLRERRLREEE
ncbi:MAG: PilZ domain-containing protein [Gammaproteobacteria bacterium]|nr:PilZ domain-containing protein [Gammaproteobacteria bacterium]